MPTPPEIDILLEIIKICDQIEAHFERTCQLVAPELQAKMRKRRSFVYSDETLFILNKIYEKRTHLTTHERKRVAREFGLTQRQVTIWFQNRRSRDEKHPLLKRIINKREGSSHGKQVAHIKTQNNQDMLPVTLSHHEPTIDSSMLNGILLNNESIANMIELKLHSLANSIAILDQTSTAPVHRNSIRDYIPPSPVLSTTESIASSSTQMIPQ